MQTWLLIGLVAYIITTVRYIFREVVESLFDNTLSNWPKFWLVCAYVGLSVGLIIFWPLALMMFVDSVLTKKGY